MTWSLGVGECAKEKADIIFTLRERRDLQCLMPFVPNDLTVMNSLKLSQFKLSFIH